MCKNLIKLSLHDRILSPVMRFKSLAGAEALPILAVSLRHKAALGSER